MYYSMTGYGKSTLPLGEKQFVVEIKSLNSKSCDLNFKAIADLRGKEIDIRKYIYTQLIRGKIDLYFQEDKSHGTASILNLSLIENYYQQLQQFSSSKNIPIGDVMPAILRFQDITKSEMPELNEADFIALLNAIESAIQQLIQFRKEEGAQLKNDVIHRIAIIQELKNKLEPFEANRIIRLRGKLKQDILELQSSTSLNENRLEEELIYYLEKMDINEEKVRLTAHCSYFIEISEDNSMEKGKKLGFIAQEIGREINTIGSKANDAAMQKIVVQMKDELEKIKEQLMNVL
ncbi:MAG TPA: DUF1732 domain-containing protein [Chitinophagales bacterium]|jgi:uncharacterized protein (TIGR00255 family)|nr:YicC family protein [Chitinophagales bacterium]MBP6153896.1 YicC family protein [Chitinophagales bacterium]HQV78724.1 DUF1732 domain-containing protein [Chitinophagales bacterium]HQW79090.1 DUF1732 domain-containing protein [Chitinophagales bacterium]HRB92039.1 DUF1732 domain-containing protein [Chitinophagales bacterium]